jgi:single-strand DNA-binding protein
MNKVIILGRLGQNPELKYTANGTAVCSLNVATSETWRDKKTGEKQEATEWHKVVVWGALAENCGKFLSKGSQVALDGKIQTRSWEDKEGNKRYTTEIVAKNVEFLGSKKERSNDQDSNSNVKVASDDVSDVHSDVAVPF